MSGRFSVGDLVWTWNLPDEKNNIIWAKLDKPEIGVIVDIKEFDKNSIGFFKQILYVKFTAGNIIKMSSNLVEHINDETLITEHIN